MIMMILMMRRNFQHDQLAFGSVVHEMFSLLSVAASVKIAPLILDIRARGTAGRGKKGQ